MGCQRQQVFLQDFPGLIDCERLSSPACSGGPSFAAQNAGPEECVRCSVVLGFLKELGQWLILAHDEEGVAEVVRMPAEG